MSYSFHALAQVPSAPPPTALAPRPDVIDIDIPPECALIESDLSRTQFVPATPLADTPYVYVFPMTKWTGLDKTDALLSAFLPRTPKQAPDVSQVDVAVASSIATVTQTVTGLPDAGVPLVQALVARSKSAFVPDFSWFAVGFIPETNSQALETRKGVFWVAFKLRTPLAPGYGRGNLQAWIVSLVRQVATSVGVTTGTLTTGVVAKGTDDLALLAAAYQATMSLLVLGLVIAGGTVLAPTFIGGEITRIAGPALAAAQHAQETYDLINGGGFLRLKAQIVQVLDQSGKIEPAKAEQMLYAVNEAIGQVKSTVTRSIEDAQKALQLAPLAEREFPVALRAAALRNATPFMNPSAGRIGSDFVKCIAMQFAQTSARQFRTALQQQLAAAVTPSQWILAHQKDISQMLVDLQRLMDQVSRARAELNLAWWQRHYARIPVWGWGIVGVGAFLSGAMVLRLVRRRKPVSVNRRRVRAA